MINSLKIKAWRDSLRLKTLPLALSSIVMGSALAYWQFKFSYAIAFLSFLTATLLQILSNLANDYGDIGKGSDTAHRIGPIRGMHKGLISKSDMRKALTVMIVLSICSGLFLLIVACDTVSDFIGFLVLGFFAIVAAITYTVGDKPYGYLGLGDVSVLIFFGFLGVLGTYYLQAKHLQFFLLLPAIGCGLLSVAVLNINNLRDIDSDRLTGKNTLVVRIGPIYGRYYHVLLLICAFLSLVLFSFLYIKTVISWLFVLLLPLYFKHGYYVVTHNDAADMPKQLVKMVAIAILTNLLFSLGLILS